MAKRALIVRGGWDGHTPVASTDIFAQFLADAGYELNVSDSLESFADEKVMGGVDLILPCWTAGELSGEQWQGVDQAVKGGAGIAGFHGGIIDAFRAHTPWQFMTGGQWVAHPGNNIPRYTVDIADGEHEITRGINSFELRDTEQYYCHVDPGVHVLCTTTFSGEHGDAGEYPAGTVMPYAWTRQWGHGRVFVAAWGHTFRDFEVSEARQIVENGLRWATR
jgi:hypothetical protein